MVGRKPKYSHPRPFTGYVDEKDLDYLDDHRGKMARMAFLFECMYKTVPNYEKIKATQEQISQLQKENHELKKKLLFAETKLSKMNKGANPELSISSEMIKFYDEKNLSEKITEMGSEFNWDNVYNNNRKNLVILKIDNSKELEKVCMYIYKQRVESSNTTSQISGSGDGEKA